MNAEIEQLGKDHAAQFHFCEKSPVSDIKKFEQMIRELLKE